MGRRNRRGRRRNTRSEAARLAAQFSSHAYKRRVAKILSDAENKELHSDYLKKLAAIEEDVLSRTVFVSSVANLNVESNLQNLKHFMESKYGIVEECCKTTFGNRRKKKHEYPPARVRFQNRLDAQKLFDGRDLISARSVEVLCPSVGYRGKIRVQPQKRYSNMAEALLSGSPISLSLSGLALGHWCPDEEDTYQSLRQDLICNETQEWLEEVTLNVQASLCIDHTQRLVEISFSSVANYGESFLEEIFARVFPSNKKNIISFRFKDLQRYISICHEKDRPKTHSLVFALQRPPNLEIECVSDDLLFEMHSTRKRVACLDGISGAVFGRCLGIKLYIDEANINRLMLHEGLEKLRDFGVVCRSLRSVQQSTEIRSVRVDPNEKDILEKKLAEIHCLQPNLGFLLRALLDHGKFSWHALLKDEVLDMEGRHWTLFCLIKGQTASSQTTQTLKKILFNQGYTKFPCRLFYKLVPPDTDELSEESVPHYCIQTPRLLLTPCQEKVTGVEVEMSNRVIRTFIEKGFSASSFLRVQVTDENGANFFGNNLNEEIETRIKTVMLSGICINGTQYEFLAYSSSQLKECSFWMVHPENLWTVKRMRESCGDFSRCRTASKYAARIGQCFSTTIRGLRGEDEDSSVLVAGPAVHHLSIDDVPAGDAKVHSDGTGLISRDAMTKLVKAFPSCPKDPRDVSIVQVRYGGVKGTLMAWDFGKVRKYKPAAAPFGVDICIRPSMNKFDAKYTNVEVCSIGTDAPYYLNRNVILLLSTAHGISDETFLSMQRNMLDDLDTMLTCSEKAASLIPRLGGPDSGLRSTLLHMILSGASPATEPFLLSCLHAMRSHHLFSLRKKSRIFVEKGAVLMGGLDETGLLPEGCVFVQLPCSSEDPPSNKHEFRPMQGPVLVTKHPVMHPGDVRMLLAVDIPELRNHRNTILFSQNGARPEADKMAGSDLDGDQFAVTWDSRLFLNGANSLMETHFQRGNVETAVEHLQRVNHTPMNYDAPTPFSQPIPDDSNDLTAALVEHFVNHTKADNLGRISMLWQDHAVKHGAKSQQCLELAELHSIAVDFPKSGVPAVLPERLLIPRDEPRAHWRELKNGRSFPCESIVGKLYDEVIRRFKDRSTNKALKGLVGRKQDNYGLILSTAESNWTRIHLPGVYCDWIPSRLGFSPHDDDASDATRSSFRLQLAANENRLLYEEEVLTLMNQYHIRTEGELFTGCIRKYHRLHKKRQHEIAEDVRRRCRGVRGDNRKRFFQTVLDFVDEDLGLGGEDDGHDEGDGEGDPDDQEVTEIGWAEGLSTSQSLSNEDCTTRDWLIRKTAFQLAAAYYMSTYSTELRGGEDRATLALFSFPWIVADVISTGLQDEAETR